MARSTTEGKTEFEEMRCRALGMHVTRKVKVRHEGNILHSRLRAIISAHPARFSFVIWFSVFFSSLVGVCGFRRNSYFTNVDVTFFKEKKEKNIVERGVINGYNRF